MRLSPDAFNTFLAGIGQQYSWRKSFACPCTNPNSGASRPDCPNCHGKGRFWAAGQPGVTGVASAKVQKNWAQSGRYETGDSVLVVPSDTPLYHAGQFDRVLLLNASDEFSITMVRGDNDVFPFPIASIKRVFWLDAESQIVDGVIPTVDADGTMSWLTNINRAFAGLDGSLLFSTSPLPGEPIDPPEGVQYSVTGVKLLEYFIFDTMPSNRGEHSGAALPKNIVARRFDTFGR